MPNSLSDHYGKQRRFDWALKRLRIHTKSLSEPICQLNCLRIFSNALQHFRWNRGFQHVVRQKKRNHENPPKPWLGSCLQEQRPVRFVSNDQRADIGNPSEPFPIMRKAVDGKCKHQILLRQGVCLCLTNLDVLNVIPAGVGVQIDRQIPRSKTPMDIYYDVLTIGKILSAIKSH